MSDGTKYVPDVDLEVGMNFPLWDRDRRGFRTSVDMVTGGVAAEFGAHAGPEVGENYQSAMGEDRHDATYVSSNAMHNTSDTIGMGAGKSNVAFSARGPQVYTRGK